MSNLLHKGEGDRKLGGREREVGVDGTFHLVTVATLDACGKLPLCVPFDARRACTRVCDCWLCVCVRETESVNVMDG